MSTMDQWITSAVVFRDPPRQGMAALSACYDLAQLRSARWAVVRTCPTPNAARNCKRRLLAALRACHLAADFEVRASGRDVYARLK